MTTPAGPARRGVPVALGVPAAWLLTGALGAVVGLTGAFWHHSQLSVDGRRWSVGVVVAVLLAVTVCATVGLGSRRRSVLVVYLLGWTIATVVASVPGPGNDLLVSGDALGQGYLLASAAGLLLAVVAVTRSARQVRPR